MIEEKVNVIAVGGESNGSPVTQHCGAWFEYFNPIPDPLGKRRKIVRNQSPPVL